MKKYHFSPCFTSYQKTRPWNHNQLLETNKNRLTKLWLQFLWILNIVWTLILKKDCFSLEFDFVFNRHWQNILHRVLGGHLTYPKNSLSPKCVFSGSEQLGEQRLLKSFCSEWQKRYTVFEKKNFLVTK